MGVSSSKTAVAVASSRHETPMANGDTQTRAHKFVDNAIRSVKVVIFMQSTCPHCVTTTRLLATYIPHVLPPGEYREVELGNCSGCLAIIDYLGQTTGAYTARKLNIAMLYQLQEF